VANADNPSGFEPYSSEAGTGVFPLVYYTADSGTTLTAGDAVIMSSGYLAIAADTSASIQGVAAKSVTATTGVQPSVPIYPATENITFVGQCSGTATQGTIGAEIDIEGGTGVMELNENASTEDVAVVVGLQPGSALGANARLLFKWKISSYSGQDA
jgi:hypothetical protein